jgi:hypothetical protein
MLKLAGLLVAFLFVAVKVIQANFGNPRELTDSINGRYLCLEEGFRDKHYLKLTMKTICLYAFLAALCEYSLAVV